MARPFQTREVHRVPVSVGDAPQPELLTPAPSVVRTPGPETSPLAGLAQILGVAGFAIGKNVQARHEQDYKQGIADEQMGAADTQYAKHHSEYARGAFETITLEQYHAAEAKVSQWASEDLDQSLPIDDQVKLIDGKMKAELGPLTQDPRARQIIGERYSTFIQTAAANIQKQQLDAHAQAALDTTMQDIASTVQRAGGITTDQWNAAAHRIISQTGDPSKANQLLVGTVAQAAENAAEAGDPNYAKIYDSIPTQVTGTDGSTLPGPMYHPKYRGIIQQSQAKAQQLYEKFHEDDYAKTQFKNYVSLDEDLANLVPITSDTLAAKGIVVGTKPGEMSPSVAANYIQQSQQSILKAQAKQAEDSLYGNARAAAGRWADIRPYLPPDKFSQDKLNDAADTWFQKILVGGGADIQQLGGVALAQNPDLVTTVAKLSAQEGVPYRPLKDTMSSINPSAPGDVTARLDAYRILKARGLAGMYVSDDAALVYEKAISAVNAGESKQGVADVIRTMGDKDMTAYVDSQMKQSTIRKTGIALDTGGGFFGFGPDSKVNSNATLNAPQIAARLEAFTMSGLSKGLSLTEAEGYAKDRVQQTMTPVNVDGKWAILPNDAIPGGNVKALTSALDWVATTLPSTAYQHGISREELKDHPLEIRPSYGLGHELEFEVTREGGVGVPLTRFSVSGLMQSFYKAHPEMTAQGQAAQVQQIKKSDLRHSEDFNVLPLMQNKYH